MLLEMGGETIRDREAAIDSAREQNQIRQRKIPTQKRSTRKDTPNRKLYQKEDTPEGKQQTGSMQDRQQVNRKAAIALTRKPKPRPRPRPDKAIDRHRSDKPYQACRRRTRGIRDKI
jgi:hypothetical protein